MFFMFFFFILPGLGNSQPPFLNTLSAPPFLLSFWDSSAINISYFIIVSVPETVDLFSVYSLLLILDKFTDLPSSSLIYPVISTPSSKFLFLLLYLSVL